MAINPANPIGYGKKYNKSQMPTKHHRQLARKVIVRRAEVQSLWEKGWLVKDMAAELGVHYDTIKRDLRVVRYQLLNDALIDSGIVLVRCMVTLRRLQRMAFEKLLSLPKNATGGKLFEELRKMVELEAKLTGAGQMNTKNVNLKSITATLTKDEIDDVVKASQNNEFDGLVNAMRENDGNLVEVVQSHQ